MDFLSQLIQGLTMKNQAPAPTQQPILQQFQPHNIGLPAQVRPYPTSHMQLGSVDSPLSLPGQTRSFGQPVNTDVNIPGNYYPQYSVYHDGRGNSWTENDNALPNTPYQRLSNMPQNVIDQPFAQPMQTGVVAQPQLRFPGQQQFPTIRI